MKRIHSPGSVCLLVSLCALLGLSCSKKDDNIPETVPVAGKVTVDGQPVTGAMCPSTPLIRNRRPGR